MKRLTLLSLIGLVVILGGLFFVDYRGYLALQALHGKVATLQHQVDDATRVAYGESAAASAANKRADEAALRAENAAGLRQQAEQQKQQAEQQRQEADVSRAQATEQAHEAQTQMLAMRREREEELNRMQEALN